MNNELGKYKNPQLNLLHRLICSDPIPLSDFEQLNSNGFPFLIIQKTGYYRPDEYPREETEAIITKIRDAILLSIDEGKFSDQDVSELDDIFNNEKLTSKAYLVLYISIQQAIRAKLTLHIIPEYA